MSTFGAIGPPLFPAFAVTAEGGVGSRQILTRALRQSLVGAIRPPLFLENILIGFSKYMHYLNNLNPARRVGGGLAPSLWKN